jgi:uncharacterized protein YbcI
LHKKIAGRGPTALGLDVTRNTVTITFFRFLTPIEQCVLRDPQNQGLVLELRNALARSMKEDWQRIFGEYGLEVVGIDGEIDFEQEKRLVRITVKEKSS